MEKAKAIELLRMAVPQDESLDEDGLFIEAVSMAIKAMEKAPTALDHIHNVVSEREYQRGYKTAKEEYDHKLTVIKGRIKDHYYNKGYEQGRKDATPKWIPFTAETAPKEDGLYFVKIKAKSGNERVKTDGYSTAYGEWFIHDNDKVKKWMPIPKDEGE